MKTKKITAVVLAVVMLLSAMAATSFTANAAKKPFLDYDRGAYLVSAKIGGREILGEDNFAEVTYTGSALKPAVVVKYGSKKLKEGTDYSLTYKYNKKPGCASVELKAKGNYSGYAYGSFYITPKSPTVVSYSVSKNSIAVKWINSLGAIGAYGAIYDANSKLVAKKELIRNDKKTHTLSIGGLKSGKKYTIKLKSVYRGHIGEDIAPDTQKIVFYT